MQVTEASLDCGRDRDAFLRLPLDLYRGNPCYVAPLLSERRRFFGADNPLFAFTEVRYYLLRGPGGRVRGRISAHINRRHNEITGERTGFFGFFECIPDPDAARALLDAAEQDLRSRGMAMIRGPFNFSTNEECGFLAEGFERPPAVMMPYTQPCYIDFMAEAGYRLARKLLAFEIASGGEVPERMSRLHERLASRLGVTIRPLDLSRFEAETDAIFRLYNRIWEKNWGFVPMTEAEFRFASAELKAFADPELILLAEKDGEPVGFLFALPDINVVLRRMKGRIWPFGWWWLACRRRLIRRTRTLMLGVTAPYRRTGLETLLYFEIARRSIARGYLDSEASWILDDNLAMRRPMERAGGRISKVYHLYEKDICASS